MNLVFFIHPPFLGSQSMPRFAKMLGEGMANRGHHIEFWTTKPFFHRLPFMKKWMGYIDQYILFPQKIKHLLRNTPQDTLFVFSDHALGPWVPLINGRPHVIHCHDFLAQNSALGKIKENPTQWTGRIYQSYIRWGYSKAKNFISVSENTRKELHEVLSCPPSISEVVYNALNPTFNLGSIMLARELVGRTIQYNLDSGYLLHVGGNQWYKNRVGVIEVYNHWRKSSTRNHPLIMIGPAPNGSLMRTYLKSPYKSEIHLLSGMNDEFLKQAYVGAALFLFPSLSEGFGWPIAEAMACGCPVITTAEPPMTEVGGKAASYIPRMPFDDNEILVWAQDSANKIEDVLNSSQKVRDIVIEEGIDNSKRFDYSTALDKIEEIYCEILSKSNL